MFNRLSLFHKGLILAFLPLPAQFLGLWLLADARATTQEAERGSLRSRAVIAQGHRVFQEAMATHNDLRGFLLTGAAKLERDREQTAQRIEQELDELEAMVDSPVQTARVRDIRDAWQELRRWQDETARLCRERGPEAVLPQVRRLEGQQRLNELEARMDLLRTAEVQTERERSAQLDASWRQLNALLIGMCVLGLVVAALVSLVFKHGVLDRLGALTDNARRLGVGEALRPPVDGTDEIAQVDRAFHDMARRVTEAAVRQAAHAEALEHRVAARTAELNERNRENELFVYSVSHDLRSPLVNLQGFGEELALSCRDLRGLLTQEEVPATVRDRALPLIDRDIGESLGYMKSATARLGHIIDALLRLSRAGRVEYHRQQVELGPLVRDVVASLRATIDSAGASVVVHDLPTVWGDPTALEQVLANLIDNALKYRDPARPLTVEVGTAEAPVQQAHAPFAVCYVRDNGRGIASAHRAKVFQAFQRLHPEAAPGEGIGLTLVARVVERHGGRVWVESTVNEGSTFFVALPPLPGDDRSQEANRSL